MLDFHVGDPSSNPRCYTGIFNPSTIKQNQSIKKSAQLLSYSLWTVGLIANTINGYAWHVQPSWRYFFDIKQMIWFDLIIMRVPYQFFIFRCKECLVLVSPILWSCSDVLIQHAYFGPHFWPFGISTLLERLWYLYVIWMGTLFSPFMTVRGGFQSKICCICAGTTIASIL